MTPFLGTVDQEHVCVLACPGRKSPWQEGAPYQLKNLPLPTLPLQEGLAVHGHCPRLQITGEMVIQPHLGPAALASHPWKQNARNLLNPRTMLYGDVEIEGKRKKTNRFIISPCSRCLYSEPKEEACSSHRQKKKFQEVNFFVSNFVAI